MAEPWKDFYKRTKMQISWPHFEREYDAFLHAVGSISHYWNFLEDIFFVLLVIGKIPRGVAEYLGFKMNNNDKIEIMGILAREFETQDPESFNTARQFFKFARTCAGNRNFVVHSQMQPTSNGKFRLGKRSKGNVGQHDTIEVDINELRQMCQDIWNTSQFGARLLDVMRRVPVANAHLRLLGAPPNPKSWENYRTE